MKLVKLLYYFIFNNDVSFIFTPGKELIFDPEVVLYLYTKVSFCLSINSPNDIFIWSWLVFISNNTLIYLQRYTLIWTFAKIQYQALNKSSGNNAFSFTINKNNLVCNSIASTCNNEKLIVIDRMNLKTEGYLMLRIFLQLPVYSNSILIGINGVKAYIKMIALFFKRDNIFQAPVN